MTHKASCILESPSLTRMYLKDRITFDQAWGIEEFIRWRNGALYMKTTPGPSQLIADFMRIQRQLRSRKGREAETILNHFVQSPTADPWTPYDAKYLKQSGWMKDMIYFMGEKLKHLPTYFGEEA